MKLIIILLFTIGFTGLSYAQLPDSVAQADSAKITLSIKSDTLNEASEASEKSVSLSLDVGENPVQRIVTFGRVFWTIVFLVVGYLSITFTANLLELLAEKSIQYRITFKSLIPIVRILGWVIIINLIVFGIFNPAWHTVLTFTASAGVAIGFASQDILKNIFGGVTILLDRPFQVGDKIEVNGFYGEVIQIGLRSTRIVTPDDNLVSIPNGDVMNQSVSNANAGAPDCQVVAEIYLPIQTDTGVARTIGMEAARTSRFIYLGKPVVVLFFNEYKDRQSVLKMRIKAYVLDIRYEFGFKSEMTERAIAELIKAGQLPGRNTTDPLSKEQFA